MYLEMLLMTGGYSPPFTKEDKHWLPKVVDNAIQGIDIGSRHPAFFQKLVTNDDLCRIFLDALERKMEEANL